MRRPKLTDQHDRANVERIIGYLAELRVGQQRLVPDTALAALRGLLDRAESAERQLAITSLRLIISHAAPDDDEDEQFGATKIVAMPDSRRSAFRRQVKLEPVTYTCAGCGAQITIKHYPGSFVPNRCPRCKTNDQQRLNRERQQRFRERRRKQAQ